MSLNIDKKQENDPNYRYKMPKPEVKYQGKNQNTFTVITNMNNISETFGHPSHTILKNIAGNGSRYDEKNNSIKGSLSYNDVLNRLYDYINHYVLCQECSKPELELKVEKKELYSECHACSKKIKLNHNKKDKKKITKDLINWIEKNGFIKRNINVHINTNTELSFDDVFD
jgi:translation initiation factor 5